MKLVKDIVVRLAATFVATALGVIGFSSVIEQTVTSAPALPLWYSASLAGAASVAVVLQKLAAALKDGSLTQDEINDAFDVHVDKMENRVEVIADTVL